MFKKISIRYRWYLLLRLIIVSAIPLMGVIVNSSTRHRVIKQIKWSNPLKEIFTIEKNVNIIETIGGINILYSDFQKNKEMSMCREDAIIKIKNGLTTLNEVIRETAIME